MNRFEYMKAPSVREAVDMMNSTVPEAMSKRATATNYIVKAGGIDLLDLIKEGVVEPERIIDLCDIPGLDQLHYDAEDGLQFGPLVTIGDLERSAEVQRHYPALSLAAAHAATPQLRNMATMGGNLMQRPRCWYFRSKDHHCRKKGGLTCYAQIGQNQYHAIFKTSVCPAVHPSSLATALLAYDGQVELTGPEETRTIPLAEFFVPAEEDVLKENVAQSKEIITKILLPPADGQTRAAYHKHGQRDSHDWSMGDVAVVLQMNGNTCTDARIVFGAASGVPLRREKAEAALVGKMLTESVIEEAAERSVDGATPLKHNGYKVPLFKALVRRSIAELIA